MQTRASMALELPLKRRIYRRFKSVLMVLFTLVCVVGGILLLADAAINHPKQMSAVRDWMVSTWLVWLAWRMVLYAVLVWGIWKVWHAPGFKPAWRTALLRMAAISLLFILVSEYALLHGMVGG